MTSECHTPQHNKDKSVTSNTINATYVPDKFLKDLASLCHKPGQQCILTVCIIPMHHGLGVLNYWSVLHIHTLPLTY
jgi:hypothetical protein